MKAIQMFFSRFGQFHNMDIKRHDNNEVTTSENIYIQLPQSPFNDYILKVKSLPINEKHINTLEVQCQADILFSKIKHLLYRLVLSR